MFSLPLFKQSIKANWVVWASLTAVMTIMGIQFAMVEMTQALLFVIFYGMMTTILPGIYVLITANKLISSQVDRGSMAYVLSTPTKRSTVAFTQSVFLSLSLVLMFAIQTIAHVIVNTAKPLAFAAFQYPDIPGDLSNTMIIQVNVSALMVCLAMAGICFAFSGIFNASKYSIGFSGVFIGETILTNMLAMFGKLGVEGLDNFKYVSIVSFYDYESIIRSNSDWIYKMIFPIGIAILGFAIGSIVFSKKDLPL